MAITLVPRAIGAPADITQIAAPMLGGEPPKAKTMADGDLSVSTQTGALTFGYPIQLPPGRGGIVPKLALSYSSQAAIYGGIAAGWSMSIPEIRWDTSKGRVRHFDQVAAEWLDEPYVSGLSGGRPLVRVTGEPLPTGVSAMYRAKNDGQFIRYRRHDRVLDSSTWWSAVTPEGVTHYFGQPALITNSSPVSNVRLLRVRAPLTSTVDSFGNSVEYRWIFDGEELRLDSIRYTKNAAVHSGKHFAEVAFTYGTAPACGGQAVGSQVDFSSGLRLVDGKSKLTQVIARAIDPATDAVVHTRQITLAYNSATESCTSSHGPFRQLLSVQESAWHDASDRVDLPAVSFEYRAASLSLDRTMNEPLWVGQTAMSQNLGWGHRYKTSQWTSVEEMMLDFDGDGLLDRMVNSSTGGECSVDVIRNDGHGNFNFLTTIALPRLPWKDGAFPDPVLGEGCFVNYQRSMHRNVGEPYECEGDQDSEYLAYRWIDMNGDGRPELVTGISHDFFFDPTLPGAAPTGQTWPTCNGDQSACPGLNYECMKHVRFCEQGKVCEIDTETVEICIDESTSDYACGDMTASFFLGGGDSMPGGPGQGMCHPDAPVRPFKLECGLYPWVYYENLGTTVDLPNPQVKLQPNGLESDSGDSSMSAGSYVGFQQGLFDLDGDGFPDSVNRGQWNYEGEPPEEIPPSWWWAFLGDGEGGFIKDPITGKHKPFFFPVPDDFFVSENEHTWSPLFDINSTQQVVDINNDNLADYINHDGASLGIHFHDGLKIRGSGTGISPDVVLNSPIAGSTIAHLDSPVLDDQFVVDAGRTAKARLIDFDGDGRPDLFRTDGLGTAGAPVASIQYNNGSNVLNKQVAPTEMALGARQYMEADGLLMQPSSYTWQTRSDLVDLDGDGILERVDFTRSPFRKAAPIDGKPPRLLTRVINGRGLQTDVVYAPMSDSSTVDNTVGPGSTASPRTQWVVKSVTTDDAFESSDGTTNYFYDDPVYGPDDEGRYTFRGFKQVTTTNPRGGKTIQRYGFGTPESPDWSGRIVSTVVQTADGYAVSVGDQTWQTKTLFGGLVTTYHPLKSTQLICAAGRTESECRASPAGRLVSIAAFTTKQHGSVPVLWVETERTTQDSDVYDDGDRRDRTTYDLYTASHAYRLREAKSESFVRVAGADTLYQLEEYVWDSTYRVALQTKERLDTGGTVATTQHTYDMATGNLLTKRKPVQVKTSGPSEQYMYDGRQLFIARVTNELGQIDETDYEYGVGVPIAMRGPNLRACTSCPADPPGAPLPRAEGSRTTVDGLARPKSIETVVVHSTNLDAFAYAQTETFTYVDSVVGSVPTSMTNKQLIEYGETRWTEVKTELDGHGRPIRTIEKVNGTAPADAITGYDYDSEGKLVAVSVPDPTQNTSAQVTYTYSFDTAGRPIGMRRPDSAVEAQRSGVDLTYDGPDVWRTEVAGINGGTAAQTILRRDVYGRLVRVDERTSATPPVYATTHYTYGPSDEVVAVVDANGIATQLDHDMAGRRTKITRGTRQWSYIYDENDNIIAELTPARSSSPPNPPSAADIAAYTSTYVYDALDRQTSKAIAPRDLNAADRELFGASTVVTTWDGAAANRIGRAATYTMRGPAGTDVISGALSYDPEGNLSIHSRGWSVSVNGGAATVPARPEAYRYAPFGKLKAVSPADHNLPAEAGTLITTMYDNRGNPLKLALARPGIAGQDVAVQARNVAGLVTTRTTTQSNPFPVLTVASSWTYDKLGRITQQSISKNTTLVARQDLTYYGLDDPKSLDQYLTASNHKKLDYSYDQRHQLVQTTSPTAAFGATNAYDTAGRITNAVVAPANLTGREARPRDVHYVYGANDADAVSQLTISSGAGAGTPYATYTYDEAGNQVSRTYYTNTNLPPTLLSTPQTWTMIYDGEDQLRRVTGPDGTIEEYWYDSEGTRTLVRKRPASGAISWRSFHASAEIEYQTDSLTDSTPTMIQTFAYASLGTPVARITNRNDSTELQFHGLASSTLATVETGVGGGTAGTVNAVFLYSPFGEVLETVGSQTATHRHRFNDKYQDAASGLSYYGHRYYDNVAMTWTQPDPLYQHEPDFAWDQPRRANRYTFSLNNSNRYVDPDGLDPPMRGSETIFVKGTKPMGEGVEKSYDSEKTKWWMNRCTRLEGQHLGCGMGLHKRRDACRGNAENNGCKPRKAAHQDDGWLSNAWDFVVDEVVATVIVYAACGPMRTVCDASATVASKAARKFVGGIATKLSKLLDDLPYLGSKGKLKGKLPSKKAVKRMSTDQLQQLSSDLSASIKTRVKANVRLGRQGNHGARERAESALKNAVDRELADRLK